MTMTPAPAPWPQPRDSDAAAGGWRAQWTPPCFTSTGCMTWTNKLLSKEGWCLSPSVFHPCCLQRHHGTGSEQGLLDMHIWGRPHLREPRLVYETGTAVPACSALLGRQHTLWHTCLACSTQERDMIHEPRQCEICEPSSRLYLFCDDMTIGPSGADAKWKERRTVSVPSWEKT